MRNKISFALFDFNNLIVFQLGSALGFLLPSVMVRDSSDMSVIRNSLRKMHATIAVASTIIFILILLRKYIIIKYKLLVRKKL